MVTYVSRSPLWKDVPESKITEKECPRCHNTVGFRLVTDSVGIGWENTPFFVETKRYYAIHCPICIYYELLTKKAAKHLGV